MAAEGDGGTVKEIANYIHRFQVLLLLITNYGHKSAVTRRREMTRLLIHANAFANTSGRLTHKL